MTQDEMTAQEEEERCQTPDYENHQDIQHRIIALFELLHTHRQEALLKELRQLYELGVEEEEDEDDGIEVEIIDDDDDDPPDDWGAKDIIDNEQPIGWIDDEPIHRK